MTFFVAFVTLSLFSIFGLCQATENLYKLMVVTQNSIEESRIGVSSVPR